MKRILNFALLVLIVLLSSQQLNAAIVNGNVLYQGDSTRPIGGVNVQLKNLTTNATQQFLTGNSGYFQFTNVESGQYKLTGTTSIPGGGVSYYDAILVFLNLIGNYQFTPIQFLASDVNGSGTITWADFNLIVKHVLYGTPFPVGPWKFESVTFSVTELKDGVPHGIGGTCSGDVGGTFVPTYNNIPALPVAQAGELKVAENSTFTTSILTSNSFSINAAGIIITYPADLLNIESIEFKGTDHEYTIDNGQIRIVWGNPNTTPISFNKNESLVTIHGSVTPEFKSGMIATFGVDGNTSIINVNNQEISGLTFASPAIKIGSPELNLSNYPNPFISTTKLSIYTPEAGNAIIEVYNTNGQLVMTTQAGMISAGYHEIVLDATKLSKGYYICNLRLLNSKSKINKSIRLVKAE